MSAVVVGCGNERVGGEIAYGVSLAHVPCLGSRRSN